MKKLILAAVIAVFGWAGANAQIGNFEAGPYLGAPVGDGGIFGFNAGATFGYYAQVVPRLRVGGIIGIDQFFGKEDDGWSYPDATFIPVAASAKFNITERFFVGLDLGYAIGVTSAAGDGGFLASPKMGISLPIVDIYGYYKAISYSYDWGDSPADWDNDLNVGSIGVGAAFRF